jgi:hypothetical protein
MGKRDPDGEPSRRARDVAARLGNLARLDGTPWLDADGLWLLSGILAVAPHPEGLAGALFAERLPPRQRLLALLGAREAVALGPGCLGGWSHALAVLGKRGDLQGLVRAGERPLHKYRGVDLPARLGVARRTLEHLSRLFRVCPSRAELWLPGRATDPSPEALIQALPLRLHALGDWPLDPFDLLHDRRLPVDALLLRLAAETDDRALAALAALLLGLRGRWSRVRWRGGCRRLCGPPSGPAEGPTRRRCSPPWPSPRASATYPT